MKDIAIYGAGGLGREVATLIELLNRTENAEYNLVGFFDDGKEIGESVSHFGKVLGGLHELSSWHTDICIAIAIADGANLKKISTAITNPKVDFPNLICPDFWISDKPTFKIGKGNIIQGACAVTTDVTLGDFNILNGSDVIGHDVVIGNYNVLMPAVRISGQVTVGDCNKFGVNSCVLQQIKVGNGVTLGAGSVMMTKPKDGNLYIGVPAKLFRY